MSREDVIMGQRVQPFIVVDRKIVKKIRRKGTVLMPSVLLTYFIIQDMSATGLWEEDLSEKKIAELSGMPKEVIATAIKELEGMGVFNEED